MCTACLQPHAGLVCPCILRYIFWASNLLASHAQGQPAILPATMCSAYMASSFSLLALQYTQSHDCAAAMYGTSTLLKYSSLLEAQQKVRTMTTTYTAKNKYIVSLNQHSLAPVQHTTHHIPTYSSQFWPSCIQAGLVLSMTRQFLRAESLPAEDGPGRTWGFKAPSSDALLPQTTALSSF